MAIREANSFATLLAQAREGSESALGELLDRYRGYLWAIANDELGSDLGPKIAASDVVQDTFVVTHRGFERFRGTSEKELKAWLRSALLNRVTDEARKYRGSQKRDVSRELDNRQPASGIGRSLLSGLHGSDSTPSTKAIREEQMSALQRALTKLPSEQCEIIVRRSMQQESFEAIGESLGRTSDAVRMVWRRAMRKLIEQMTYDNA